MNKLFALLFISLTNLSLYAVKLPSIPTSIKVTVTEFGANTKLVDNTSFIQKAIDDVAAKGGGLIIVPKGEFLCGPIALRNKTELHLDAGAVLKMLPYGEGNGLKPGSYPNSGKEGVYNSLITATNITDAAITGKGLIDGQGQDWWAAYRLVKGTSTVMKRGCLIALNGSKNILIEGIKLIDAPNVHIAIGKKSSDVTVDDITIECPEEGPNTDGIDVWAPNVVIKNSSISCGDDNIAMDTGTNNITIKNCFFGAGHGCSIGSYTHNIQNVLVDSCRFDGTDSAVRMKTSRNRGGGERNIVYSNIEAKNVKCAVYITSYYPKVPKKIEEDQAQPVTENTPTWKDITIKNLVVKSNDQSIEIWGVPEMPISNVRFENVQIHSKQGIKLYNAANIVFKNSTVINSKGEEIKLYNCEPPTGIDLKTGKTIN